MQWSGIISTGIVTVLLACCVAGLAVLIRRQRYKQLLTSVQDQRFTRITAYRYLCQTTERATSLVLFTAIFSAISGVIFAILYLFPSYPPVKTTWLVGSTICFFLAPCLTIPRFLYDLLGVAFVDVPALADFHNSSIETKDATLLCLKQSVLGPLSNERRFTTGLSLSLLGFCLLEALGLLCLFDLMYLLWLPPLLSLVWAACNTFLGRQIVAWTTYAAPIEQSTWASLLLHIGEWARVAGVRQQDIRVQTMIRVGRGNSAVCGMIRPMLLLNNTFLANSEWRQQEALVASLLGLVQRRVPAVYTWISNVLFVVTWTLLTLLVATLVSFSSPRTLVFLSVVLLIMLIVDIALVLFIHRWLSHNYARADHLTSELTSDPVAIMIALHTIHVLTTASPRLPPFIARRIDALNKLIQQPDRQNLWMDRPVPSVLPFAIGTRTFTTNLTPTDTSAAEDAGKIIPLDTYRSTHSMPDTDEPPPDEPPFPEVPSTEGNP